MNRRIDVLLGLQWGDEGKGKVVDTLVPNYDIIARFQGGPNAGHTVEANGKQIILHMIPSGALHSNKLNVLGAGMVIDPIGFMEEYNKVIALNSDFRVMIDFRATLIHPIYLLRELLSEARRAKNGDKIGSTLRGICPAYTSLYARESLKMGDTINPNFLEMYESCKYDYGYLLQQASSLDFDLLGEFKKNQKVDFELYEQNWMEVLLKISRLGIISNASAYIHKFYNEGKRILAEGAQGVELDIFYGDYPFVTSSHTTVGGVCIGLGVPPQWIGDVYGIIKAGYVTKVGGGEFPGRMEDSNEEDFWQQAGNEVGATTGRKRMCGHHDFRQLTKAIEMNGVTKLVITKADICPTDTVSVIGFDGEKIDFPGWKISEGVSREDSLPSEFKSYVAFLEKSLGVPVVMIGTGPDRKDIIHKENAFRMSLSS